MNTLADQSQVSNDIINAAAGLSSLAETMPQVCIMSFVIVTTCANIPKVTFENVDLPLEEFYFGNPSAWTFDNLWDID